MKRKYLFSYIFIGCLLVFITACTAQVNESLVNQTLEPGLPEVETMIPSNTFTLTPTATVTMTPTIISMPTFSATEAYKFVQMQLASNGECDLPCIWGVKPSNDESAFRETFRHMRKGGEVVISEHDHSGGLTYFRENEKGQMNLSFVYDFRNNLRKMNLILENYGTKNGVYTGLYGSPDFKYYEINKILTKYGEPSEVLVGAWLLEPRSGAEYEKFTISLYYPENGFLIEYEGNVEKKIDQKWNLCPWNVNVNITSWDPNTKPALEQLDLDNADTWIPYNLDYFKSIEEASGLKVDEFYDLFKNDQTQTCIETDARLWTRSQ